MTYVQPFLHSSGGTYCLTKKYEKSNEDDVFVTALYLAHGLWRGR